MHKPSYPNPISAYFSILSLKQDFKLNFFQVAISSWSLETNDLVQNENMEKRGEGNFLQFNFRP